MVGRAAGHPVDLRATAWRSPGGVQAGDDEGHGGPHEVAPAAHRHRPLSSHTYSLHPVTAH